MSPVVIVITGGFHRYFICKFIRSDLSNAKVKFCDQYFFNSSQNYKPAFYKILAGIKWMRWQYDPNDKQTIELQAQIKEADEINNNSSNSNITSDNLGISYNTHSEASYASRLLDFNNLPEPKNSDDYYEQNDNIISEKFSESIEALQIDISQLNINMIND
ncbi:hypothetical protein C1646_671771 [Rhizophagus diaphanus]|nr:hypothetical protein C1646_671771 [Rhizophagus diaphanus] [Rhizophagus sp. MUCL 43196]